MFDYVKYECDCPKCGKHLTNFQTKDADCYYETLDPRDVNSFYAICPHCEEWINVEGGNANFPKSRGQKIIDEFSSILSKMKLPENFDKAVETIENYKGKVITTGMGKAGIAMRKFSSTLCSLGTPASFLHPGEASHGDLGMMDKNDLLFVASTSGKTREIIEVVDLSRAINSQPIIGLTSHPDSVIRQKADIILDMGEFKEVDTLNMAPTTSIMIMQVLTDTIALVVSENKNFTKSDFGKLHHSGYLGELARGEITRDHQPQNNGEIV